MTTFFFSTACNLQVFIYGSNMEHTVHDSLTHTLVTLSLSHHFNHIKRNKLYCYYRHLKVINA